MSAGNVAFCKSVPCMWAVVQSIFYLFRCQSMKRYYHNNFRKRFSFPEMWLVRSLSRNFLMLLIFLSMLTPVEHLNCSRVETRVHIYRLYRSWAQKITKNYGKSYYNYNIIRNNNKMKRSFLSIKRGSHVMVDCARAISTYTA